MTILATPPLFPVPQAQETSDDYYTPKWVFDAMALTFDIDVCSPPTGVPWIPAKRYFTKADDGLSQPWEGRVWMNPPFSETTAWADRFIAHANGVALFPFAKSAWLHRIWDEASGIVPLSSRLKFVGGSIFIATFLAAFGEECVEAIGRVGKVR